MSTPERNRIMLASAKRNLESMAFVGLTEQQKVKTEMKITSYSFRILIMSMNTWILHVFLQIDISVRF